MDKIRTALEKYIEALSKYQAGKISYNVLERTKLDYEKTVEVYTQRTE